MKPRPVIAAFSIALAQLSSVALVLLSSPAPLRAAPDDADRERARLEVDAFYAAPADPSKVPPYAARVAELGHADGARRAAAAAHLEALLRVLFDDDVHGRGPVQALPFWGGGARRAARELRVKVASELARGPRTPEAAGPLAWLATEERAPAAMIAGARGLVETPGPTADEAIAAIVSRGHPAGEVLAACVTAHAARRGEVATPALLRLAGHHRAKVREAARAALAVRGARVAPFDPAAALGDEVRALLAPVASFAVTAIPGDARLVDVEVALEDEVRRGHEGHVALRGLLVADGPRERRLLTVHLEERDVPTSAELRDVALADEVARLVAARAGDEPNDVLSRRGMLTGQFEAQGATGWEVLLGAHLLARGDAAAAARVLLPLFDGLADDRFLVEIARDQWGRAVFRAMLERFAGDRDHEGAAALARHLVERFPGHPEQALAARLARELPARLDEFRSLTNPRPADWRALVATLPRAAAIVFLRERLRLLNCFQDSQPGGVEFHDVQHAEPEGMRDAAWSLGRGRTEVINPLVELEALGLTVDELPLLTPALEDDRTIPTVGFWRDFAPGRHTFTVAEVAGALIDRVARQPLCGPALALPLADRRPAIEAILAWVEARRGKGRDDLLLEGLARDQRWGDARDLVEEALARRVVAAVPLLLRYLERADTRDADRARILLACARLDGRAALVAAERLVDHGAPEQRLAAGDIVFRHGDRARGRRALVEGLAAGTRTSVALAPVLAAVRALLETGAPEDLEAAAVVFGRDDLLGAAWGEDRDAIIAAFGDRGGHAHRFYLRLLRSAGGDAHREEQLAREVASGLGRGRVEWPEGGDAAAKAAAARVIRGWLEVEGARLAPR